MNTLQSASRAWTVRRVAAACLGVVALAVLVPANAAWFDPVSGLWYGNVCQTAVGWQVVPAAPVGARCYAPAFGAGVITN
jgi:hypothetical protein